MTTRLNPSRSRSRWLTRLTLVVGGVAIVMLAFELWIGFTEKGWGSPLDYDAVMAAARRWVAGGSYFLDRQVHGPYLHGDADVLYPPTALVLFVPFSFLPTLAWYAVPIAISAAALWRLRPALWALALIAVLACWPDGLTETILGNPLLFVVAALFSAAAWSTSASLILLKPSLLPFAFFRANTRAWWLGLALLVALSVPFLPLNVQWIQVVADSRGRAGIWYSLSDVPYVAIPLVAWLGRRVPRNSAEGPS